LTVPALVFTPASSLPEQLVEWIDGPPPSAVQVVNEDAAGARPLHGFQPGDPTPAAQAVPTVQPNLPTPTPSPLRAPEPALAPRVAVGPPRQVDLAPQAVAAQQAAADLRWAGTGVVRSGGMPVYVRRVAGVDSRDDPRIADGSAVLISSSPPLVVGAQAWRAIRGLNGVVGWVPSGQLAVDGEASQSQSRSTSPNSSQDQSQSASPNANPHANPRQSQSTSTHPSQSQSQSQSPNANPSQSQGLRQPPLPRQGLSQAPAPSQGLRQPPLPRQGLSQAPAPSQGLSQPPPPSQGLSQPPPPSQGLRQPPPPSQGLSQRLAPSASSTAQSARGSIANTGGSGVVLRNSPNDGDRSHAGLMDGAQVSLLEYFGQRLDSCAR
jgi:hypothetical protein